ncbi:MAG: hypothetical protein ACRD11_11765 [Terriglobia bacterium]
MRVLIVEDEKNMTGLLKKKLAEENPSVSVALSGRDALEFAGLYAGGDDIASCVVVTPPSQRRPTFAGGAYIAAVATAAASKESLPIAFQGRAPVHRTHASLRHVHATRRLSLPQRRSSSPS